MPKPTRAELIDLATRALPHVETWCNRDSADAIRQIGEAWALLRTGCAYTARRDGETWWVKITYPGFNDMEYSTEPSYTELFYLPTATRLAQAEPRFGGCVLIVLTLTAIVLVVLLLAVAQ